jgi:hypothetical protein
VPIRGASKGEIANGIAKFDLTVHASILLHIVAHFCFIKRMRTRHERGAAFRLRGAQEQMAVHIHTVKLKPSWNLGMLPN